jgi:DNA replication protein DnaC
MSPIDDLIPLLKRLKLSGILDTLDLRTKQAADDSLSHPEFLLRILSDEVERREGNMLSQRLRRAHFEHAKTLEDFDFHFNANVPKRKVIDLATCSFVGRKRNALILGPSGVGKSHIAQAIGHRACQRGYQVLFLAAHDMLQQLRASQADGSQDRVLQRLAKPDLLIIDDLGLRALKDDEPIDLYDVIRHRYERGSCIITLNRTPQEVGSIFQDPLIASAAMDRLLHDAEVIVIEGDSYRNPPPKKRERRKVAARKRIRLPAPRLRSELAENAHAERRKYRIRLAAPNAIQLPAP